MSKRCSEIRTAIFFRGQIRIVLKASSIEKGVRANSTSSDERVKTTLASEVGMLLAQRAKDKGLSRVVFDRAGYLYHGRVKALADGARQGGLDF